VGSDASCNRTLAASRCGGVLTHEASLSASHGGKVASSSTLHARSTAQKSSRKKKCLFAESKFSTSGWPNWLTFRERREHRFLRRIDAHGQRRVPGETCRCQMPAAMVLPPAPCRVIPSMAWHLPQVMNLAAPFFRPCVSNAHKTITSGQGQTSREFKNKKLFWLERINFLKENGTHQLALHLERVGEDRWIVAWSTLSQRPAPNNAPRLL